MPLLLIGHRWPCLILESFEGPKPDLPREDLAKIHCCSYGGLYLALTLSILLKRCPSILEEKGAQPSKSTAPRRSGLRWPWVSAGALPVDGG